ncbi:MAG: heavy metal translocating P-type ATPase [Prosthecobacter sp.]|uniref:heavy metal translocating P-type ATPase n=1 Tax=Prosthecobacter sp. TaxID=1965333 RepID=UPI003BB1F9C0
MITPKAHDSESHASEHGHDHAHDHSQTAPESIALNPDAKGDEQTILRIAGMDCADEVAALEQVLRPLKGVREVRVNLMGGKVTLLHEASLTTAQLISAIGTTGMKAALDGEAAADLEGAKRVRQIAVAVSGVSLGLGMLIEWFKVGPGWSADVGYAVAIIAGGWFTVPKAWRALRRLALDMNVLMTVAVAGALMINQWSEGAAVTFLFALSELLEAYSLARARKAVQALMQLTPETALLKEGDEFREVPVAEVVVGATIAVKSGARIPLDGEVVKGNSAVNQAPITGESMPVEKKPGDGVFAGTINGSGSLDVRTTKASSDSMLAKIIHLVEEAQSQKAPSQRFVDVFARWYTPVVMVAAVLVMLLPPLFFGGVWLAWFYRALVLLVIACPCALVISTPVSVVSGLTAMARRGVLIKGGAVLEAVGKLKALCVDKTGTITEGKPRVTHVILVSSKDETEIIRIAAAIDTHSEHPLAQAVVIYAKDRKDSRAIKFTQK